MTTSTRIRVSRIWQLRRHPDSRPQDVRRADAVSIWSDGVAHRQTLDSADRDERGLDFIDVGALVPARSGRDWSLATRSTCRPTTLSPKQSHNPSAGKEHWFRAWRLKGSPPMPSPWQRLEPIGRFGKRSRRCESEMPDARLIETDAFAFEFLSRTCRARELAKGNSSADLSRPQMVGQAAGLGISRHPARLPSCRTTPTCARCFYGSTTFTT